MKTITLFLRRIDLMDALLYLIIICVAICLDLIIALASIFYGSKLPQL